MLCCAVVMLGWAMPLVIIVWGCFEIIVVLCCCDVGCDLGWAMQLVWGCFWMVGPLQESAEAGCALQCWTRSAAAVTIAVDLDHP